ncbi:hypothetical protein [Paracraurococcus lichenis]|uniref:Uncharacterized protein n=1 Tax=Paracraurococcus lichenis TaxID=3064888 RepID=A0ABT9EC11_9PROT|nr:hypothetical protein [Paracraurococcus sp. LOR1-02]MDO9713758.1 hypothetical protein [Paracraurococcus sp. LOR1-02]
MKRPRRTASLPAMDDFIAVNVAAHAYVRAIGEAPPIYQFRATPGLARELTAAAERGERLTAGELARRLGTTAPPDDVEV